MPYFGGHAPLQKKIWNDGPENAYLADHFPRLDYLKTCENFESFLDQFSRIH